MNDNTTDLEIRMMYQEASLQELNDVIIRQQKQIDTLAAEVKRLREQIESSAELVRPIQQETPPPHY